MVRAQRAYRIGTVNAVLRHRKYLPADPDRPHPRRNVRAYRDGIADNRTSVAVVVIDGNERIGCLHDGSPIAPRLCRQCKGKRAADARNRRRRRIDSVSTPRQTQRVIAERIRMKSIGEDDVHTGLRQIRRDPRIRSAPAVIVLENKRTRHVRKAEISVERRRAHLDYHLLPREAVEYIEIGIRTIVKPAVT